MQKITTEATTEEIIKILRIDRAPNGEELAKDILKILLKGKAARSKCGYGSFVANFVATQ